MLSRSTIRRTAAALLLMMVYVQGALAATLCSMQFPSAAAAIVQSDGPPCHETAGTRPNLNLCVAHCLSEDQSLDKPLVTVLAFSLVATGVLHVDSLLHARQAHRIAPHAVALGPPPRILFQSLKL